MKTNSTKGGSSPRHQEAKKPRTVHATDASWQRLDEIARQFLISRSELVELIGAGVLTVSRDESKTA